MDEALKYLPLVTVCVTVIGASATFLVGLLKWIAQRKTEQEQRQYEAFHRMVCIASGVDETGRVIKMAQQVAAIYQLQAYKQYAFAAIPVLQQLRFELGAPTDPRADYIETALNNTIKALSEL
ncbi:hypothetical protein [Rhodoferax saidenbachensis]|uniref:DUF4129 domain-containing protein n=1 Tax=Rhodoferax saidenbachensis TaxID=1484693 RepID=A0ABU1ZQE0_9BURK|nr:hypothetical protein [Rhodoferax saidenbachensis]MDR7307755.1 hypothetical protein [Rhodoferax saidenbachensis]